MVIIKSQSYLDFDNVFMYIPVEKVFYNNKTITDHRHYNRME